MNGQYDAQGSVARFFHQDAALLCDSLSRENCGPTSRHRSIFRRILGTNKDPHLPVYRKNTDSGVVRSVQAYRIPRRHIEECLTDFGFEAEFLREDMEHRGILVTERYYCKKESTILSLAILINFVIGAEAKAWGFAHISYRTATRFDWGFRLRYVVFFLPQQWLLPIAFARVLNEA
jgi:hypothetical protein